MEQTQTGLNVVLGAGPVGRELCRQLLAAGQRVRIVTRSGKAEGAAGAETLAADIGVLSEAQRACAGAAVVYACVGLDYRGWPTLWPPMMQGMLAGAEAAGARLVFMDNLYMYGPAPMPLREDLPLTNYGVKPATRARITRMWQESHARGRVKVAAVRASDFYGPGVRRAILGDFTFAKLLAGQAGQCVGNPDLPHSFAYVPDVARALRSVGEGEDSDFGQAWHVPNAPDRTLRELVAMFAKEAQVTVRLQAAPAWLVHVAGLFDPNMHELAEMLYQWTRPFTVDASKFAARFWSDATPFEQGIRETAQWYTQQAGKEG